MPEQSLDEFLNEHADAVQQGSDTAVTGYIPPIATYTTKLLPMRLTTGKDKATGAPVGYLILPHKILNGPEEGQVFEYMGDVSNRFFAGALKTLAAMLSITTQDPRAMLRELEAKIKDLSPVVHTRVTHYTNPNTGKVSGNYSHEALVGA